MTGKSEPAGDSELCCFGHCQFCRAGREARNRIYRTLCIHAGAFTGGVYRIVIADERNGVGKIGV